MLAGGPLFILSARLWRKQLSSVLPASKNPRNAHLVGQNLNGYRRLALEPDKPQSLPDVVTAGAALRECPHVETILVEPRHIGGRNRRASTRCNVVLHARKIGDCLRRRPNGIERAYFAYDR